MRSSASLCKLADLWFTEAPPLRIEPIHSDHRPRAGWHRREHRHAGACTASPTGRRSSCLTPTGRSSATSTASMATNSSGNVFDTGFDVIKVGGAARLRHAGLETRSASRSPRAAPTVRTTSPAAAGDYVAEGGPTMHEKQPDGSLRCVVARGLLRASSSARLVQAGVLAAPGVVSAGFKRPPAGPRLVNSPGNSSSA